MTNKKVLLIANNKYTSGYGIEKYHRFLIPILRKQMYDIDEFNFNILPTAKVVANEFTYVNSITSNYYDDKKNIKNFNYFEQSKSLRYGWKKISELINNNHYDLIICSVQMTTFSKKQWNQIRVPIIFIQHTSCGASDLTTMYGKFLAFFFRKIIKLFTKLRYSAYHANHIVVFTESDKLAFTKRYGNNKNFYIIPLTVEEYESQPEIKFNERDHLLWSGRLENAQKHFKLLLQMDKHLNIPIHVYGNGDLQNLLEIKQYKNIIYKGVYQQKEIREIFSNCKACLCVSRYEGLPYVLVEALSVGRPIILLDTFESAKFLIDNGNNGLLVKKHTRMKKICKKIEIFLNKYDFNKSQEKILKFYENNLSNKEIESKWINLLNNIIK